MDPAFPRGWSWPEPPNLAGLLMVPDKGHICNFVVTSLSNPNFHPSRENIRKAVVYGLSAMKLLFKAPPSLPQKAPGQAELLWGAIVQPKVAAQSDGGGGLWALPDDQAWPPVGSSSTRPLVTAVEETRPLSSTGVKAKCSPQRPYLTSNLFKQGPELQFLLCLLAGWSRLRRLESNQRNLHWSHRKHLWRLLSQRNRKKKACPGGLVVPWESLGPHCCGEETEGAAAWSIRNGRRIPGEGSLEGECGRTDQGDFCRQEC